ncbi:MAG: GNAT family N-acetyltransferase [Beutenbergiaceae bacterium]
MTEQVEVRQVADKHQFQILLDGVLVGHIDYSEQGVVRAMPHTLVDPAYRGRGLATRLIKEALDHTRAEGLAVLPICPAIAAYIERHPDYRDIVAQPRSSDS